MTNSQAAPEPLLLTTVEVAAILGVTPKTVRARVLSGDLIAEIDGRGRGHAHRFNPHTMRPKAGGPDG